MDNLQQKAVLRRPNACLHLRAASARLVQGHVRRQEAAPPARRFSRLPQAGTVLGVTSRMVCTPPAIGRGLRASALARGVPLTLLASARIARPASPPPSG